MKVLSIGADRSKRGILVPGSPAYARQKAYAEKFGALDIIGYSLRSDGFVPLTDGPLSTYPTNAPFRLLYGTYALLIASRLPKPDVVTAQDAHGCGLLALMIARTRGVPLHIQVHTDIFDRAFASLSIANRVKAFVARFVLARADGIRVVSDRVKDSIELNLTPRHSISVLPIYIDHEAYSNITPDPALTERFGKFAKKLLVVSRLEKEKRVLLALNAFADEGPTDSCLIILGSGSEREALEERARERGITDRVFFEGEQDPRPYYALADLVLVPSRYEGYGMVIIEALASGTPVLSTDVGIAKDAGAIVTSPELFAASLSEWLDRGARAASLKKYPYENFQAYVDAYCADIARCIKK